MSGLTRKCVTYDGHVIFMWWSCDLVYVLFSYRYPTFDVYVVESLLGTYIANRKIPSSSYGSTVISFDKGGEWRPINPPAVDRNGQPIACNPVSHTQWPHPTIHILLTHSPVPFTCVCLLTPTTIYNQYYLKNLLLVL